MVFGSGCSVSDKNSSKGMSMLSECLLSCQDISPVTQGTISTNTKLNAIISFIIRMQQPIISEKILEKEIQNSSVKLNLPNLLW